MLKFIRLSTFFVYSTLCFGVAAYAFYFMFQTVNPYNEVASKLLTAGWSVPIHVFASGLALLLVPFQLSKKIRTRYKKWHKYNGYLYVFAVVLGSISGYLMSLNATGGAMAEWGFKTMAILWLPTTIIAVIQVIKGNIIAHKRWMYRSIALTSAAITFRIYLGIGLGALQLPFLTVYIPISWMCWVLNLIVIELIIYNGRNKKTVRIRAFA